MSEMKKKTRVVVDISGGLINAVYTNDLNADMEIVFLDEQIDGAEEDQIIELGGQEYYATTEVPMLNRHHVFGVFAALNPDGFEFGINIHPPLPDGTLNPFDKNFRTADDAEAAGQQYLKEHPETESFAVFVLELVEGQVVGDESLYTFDRLGPV